MGTVKYTFSIRWFRQDVFFSFSILLDRPVEPEALAGRRPARPAGPLLRLGLGDDGHAERLHAVLVDTLL